MNVSAQVGKNINRLYTALEGIDEAAIRLDMSAYGVDDVFRQRDRAFTDAADASAAFDRLVQSALPAQAAADARRATVSLSDAVHALQSGDVSTASEHMLGARESTIAALLAHPPISSQDRLFQQLLRMDRY